MIDSANKYIEVSAPWTLNKEKRTEELKFVILSLAEALRTVAQAVRPFMPVTAESIWKQLGIPSEIDRARRTKPAMPGLKIAKGAPLFPRIETDR